MKFKAFADNVLIELLPHPKETASGIQLVQLKGDGAKEHRKARVLSSGTGRYTKLGAFIPNEVRAGDIVLVSSMCGDKTNWSRYDVGDEPRSNEENARLDSLDGERGEYRVVRHDEILAVIEQEAQAAE